MHILISCYNITHVATLYSVLLLLHHTLVSFKHPFLGVVSAMSFPKNKHVFIVQTYFEHKFYKPMKNELKGHFSSLHFPTNQQDFDGLINFLTFGIYKIKRATTLMKRVWTNNTIFRGWTFIHYWNLFCI